MISAGAVKLTVDNSPVNFRLIDAWHRNSVLILVGMTGFGWGLPFDLTIGSKFNTEIMIMTSLTILLFFWLAKGRQFLHYVVSHFK